eukprot:239041-Prorocentrum_minimum.AAC.4
MIKYVSQGPASGTPGPLLTPLLTSLLTPSWTPSRVGGHLREPHQRAGGLADTYVNAINAGAVPVIATAWQGVAEAECRRAVEEAEAAYAAAMAARNPRDEEAAYTAAMALAARNLRDEEHCFVFFMGHPVPVTARVHKTTQRPDSSIL